MWMQFIKCGGEIILKLIIKPACIFDSAQFIMMALKRLDFVQNETCILLNMHSFFSQLSTFSAIFYFNKRSRRKNMFAFSIY